MSSTQDASSPSASSIFLPLGRRTRRDSRSSLSNELDQDALSQALNTIHSAASQSQVLTVFNEYTDPPAAASKGENKSLASDLQGGLSGLYNKLRASVGVPKDSPEAVDHVAGLNSGHERSSSKTSSGRASKVQSPRMQAFDSPVGIEVLSHTSKLSSKATSISKTSLPATPALKSPTGPPHPPAHIVDPALTEINIHATNKPAVHSRTGSQYDTDVATQERKGLYTGDDEPLRKALSRTGAESPDFVRQERRLMSPSPLPLRQNILHLQPSHERGASEQSISNQSTTSGQSVRPLSPIFPPEGNGVNRILSRHQEPTSLQKAASNPLELLAEHSGKSGKASASGGAKANESGLRPTASPSSGSRQKERTLPRVSQSRLPGFQASRASSTDSGPNSAVSPLGRIELDKLIDGAHDLNTRPNASKPLNKLRSKLLSKEFWMRDENARDCFHCGEPFSTFRRKHHCRTCGQIFDNKCTVLVDGNHFGSAGAIRVCKPCEAIIVSHDDDSSDYSVDDLALPESINRPRTPEPSQLLRSSNRFDDDNASIISQSLEQMAKTPIMNFPVRRAFEGGDRSSKILEFETMDRPLPRPSSSRSLKVSHLIGHGHKRHHSRHQHIRNFKAYHEERAPFQKRTGDDVVKDPKTSAFHRDSIIDPDLAQYLSDDASSDDEQSLNINLNEDKLSRSVPGNEKTGIGGLFAAVRKGRSRIGERSIAGFLNLGRDGDDAIAVSSRGIDTLRPPRKRNLSVASSVHQRLTPKSTRERLQIVVPGSQDAVASVYPQTQHLSRASRMIRSASMHGLGAPSMELNRASIQHVHKLLQQLLKDADVVKVQSWEEALVPILLRATDDVDPDVQGGDDIDIRNYVKLKKIPGGKPGDTAYISGLIFSKNVALKSMSRFVSQPRVLIITFALEYARHEQHFMSLDPVIRQEREYLENLVGRIAALKPDVLLAQRNISGLALELLDRAKIATIFNVKFSILEAVSRCTRTRVAHSMDKLTSQAGHLGSCESFEVKTFVSEGRKKTYIYFSGCPPALGCTVAIRGAEPKMLSKIKRITEFMIYVVYNLKLETCLMRDEWALIPSALNAKPNDGIKPTPAPSNQDSNQQTGAGQPLEHARLPENSSATATAHFSNVDVTSSQPREGMAPASRLNSTESAEIPDDIPVPTFYEDLVDKHQTKILSASPLVKFMQPYLLMRARELERRVAYLKRLRDQDVTAEKALEDKARASKFTLISPEMVHTSLAGASKKVREIIHAVHDAEYDKALHNYHTQKKQWEAYLSGNRNLFDPYAHQNIVVMFSQVCSATSVPCLGPDLLAFSFYNEHEHEEEFEADCTLGQYVEDLCYRAEDTCASESCEKKMYEHHRQYVHGEAQITVFVQPYPAKMRGLQDVILMWSQCKICGVETTVTPMSGSTWKYSFGKYLELSFWSADLHARAGICPHDLHRDHLRYFGYKDFALRVHYDPIDLLEIIVPRMRITWKVDNDLRFRNDVFSKLEQRITRFMVSVKLRLKSINVEALLPENAESCRIEIEQMTKKANEEHVTLVKQLQERYSNSRHWETIPLNRVVRATQEKVAEWENAFTEFENNFFPSEKDIRRLATLQLKKIFLDRDVSVTSLISDNDGLNTPPTEDQLDEKSFEVILGDDGNGPQKIGSLSPEKTQNVLQSVLKEHANVTQAEVDISPDIQAKTDDVHELPIVFEGPRHTDDIQHLDLALPLKQGRILPPAQGLKTMGPDRSNIENVSGGISLSISDKALENEHLEILAVGPVDQGVDTEVNTSHLIDLQPSDATSLSQCEVAGKSISPALLRAHSQPAGSIHLRRESSQGTKGTLSAINALNGFGSIHGKINGSDIDSLTEVTTTEKKLSDRLGLGHLKNNKFVKNHSFIPRAISNRKDSRVSNLARHFEQLSREFERERAKERKSRAARSRQARAYPISAPKPIVEVYKDVDEAVDEKNSSDDIFDLEQSSPEVVGNIANTAEGMAQTDPLKSPLKSTRADEMPTDATENEAEIRGSSHAPSEAEDQSDADDVSEEIYLPESPEDLLRLSREDIDLKDLPKHERGTLMKMLTNFWAERSSSGWTSLDYPLGASEHVFADCDIIVREDEPSSIIAFALDSTDYKTKLYDIQDHAPLLAEESTSRIDGNDIQMDVMHSLLRKTGTHLKYQFQEGPAKMMCKIFFAEQFDAVRRKCGVADRVVESLSRCMKWDSKGGKTKSLFLKTLDDRFVLKSLSTIETQSFLQFAPNYFQIMSEAFFHELPSVIAKMLGFYQIIVKNPGTGVEYNWFLLVMENLFYDRTPTRIFDLKGSMRNRKINATGERNEVLLDENMVEFIYESPLFTREHSKKLLRSSVHNDTLFLARQNVMDYSLMVAIDENRKELVVGIIDCIRTYTWDKKLESWIKDRGFAGGGKNRPTVTSPKEYKRRFREAMGRYVLEAPNCWHQFKPVKVEKKILRIGGREDGEKGETEVQILS